MTDPASQPTVDRHRAILLVASGVVAGLTIGMIWVWNWFAPNQGASVTLLGSGKQVSVLVTNQQRRVLFVSGTDGSGFSNAIADALPPIGDKVDILLIDSGASADVVERARRLDYEHLITLPGPETDDGLNVANSSFNIDVGESLTISVQLATDGNWNAAIELGETRLVVVPNSEITLTDPASIVVSLAGVLPESGAENASIFAGPATNDNADLVDYLGVSSGETERIEIRADRVSIPSGSVQNPTSGE